MDEYLRQLLRNYQNSQDPEDAVKYADAMLRVDMSPQPLDKPLTPQEIVKQMKKTDGFVEGYVAFDALELIRGENFELLLDNLSNLLVGTPLLPSRAVKPPALAVGI